MTELSSQQKHQRLLLGSLLLLVFLSRLIIAMNRCDTLWPDEHYQSLEPAADVVWGYSFKAWEWLQAWRSWIYPGLYIPLFSLLKFFGVNGGPVAIEAARVSMSLFSVAGLFGFFTLLKQLNVSFVANLTTCVLFALSPTLTHWSPSTLADVFLLHLTCILAPAFYWGYSFTKKKFSQKSKLFFYNFILATLICLPFLIKVQMLVYSGTLLAGVLIADFFQTKKIPFFRFYSFLSAFILCSFFYGLIDFITWGEWFISALNQILRGAEISKTYGVSPFYSYFEFFYREWGFTSCLAFAGFISVSTLVKKIRMRICNDTALVLLIAASLAFFIAHCCIDHKELRFISLFFPILFIPVALTFDALSTLAIHPPQFPESIETFRQKKPLTTSIIVLLVVSFLTFLSTTEALTRPAYNRDWNLALVQKEIFKWEHEHNNTTANCVVNTIGGFWLGRMHLMSGRPLDFHQKKISELTPEAVRTCTWVLTFAREASYIPASALLTPISSIQSGVQTFILWRVIGQ